MSISDITKKKLNLLVHLAKIDGRYDASEKKVLQEMLAENGISGFDEHRASLVLPSEFQDELKREEILYWTIKMITADNIVHSDELAYSKALAINLGFKPALIDFLLHEPTTTLETFKARMLDWNNEQS
jgi:hypothetical protein